MSDTPAVEARELTRTFGSFTAVDRISFQVAQGEVFGFLGASLGLFYWPLIGVLVCVVTALAWTPRRRW